MVYVFFDCTVPVHSRLKLIMLYVQDVMYKYEPQVTTSLCNISKECK